MNNAFSPVVREHVANPVAPVKLPSALISFFLITLITVGFLASSDALWHWFIIPVWMCGILIGIDCVNWIRGRVDILDPVGIISLLGLHFFFFAPLLHVYWDRWMGRVVPPEDWRPWLGLMALLNAIGFVFYHIWMSRQDRRATHDRDRVVWVLDRRKFLVLTAVSLLITGVVQLLIFSRYGGIFGYIDLRDQRLQDGSNALAGMGWLFMIAESFPILALMGFVVFAKERGWSKNWLVILLVLLTFFALRMLFGGLRGSRSHIIWSMVWAIVLIHLWLRRVSRTLILLGLAVLIAFMYIYGLYKSTGSAAFSALTDLEEQSELAYQTGRTIDYVVLFDLGRSDVQSFILYRLLTGESTYDYAWGRTYIGALALPIPRAIWANRPPTKLKEGTEVQYGHGSYFPSIFWSARQYGIAGEAMLNYGPLAVPLTFVVFAFVLRKVRRWYSSWGSADARSLLLPLLINLCFALLVYDSDNLVFFQIKNGLLPFLVIAGSAMKQVEQSPE